MNLRQLVRQAVIDLGECTIGQVIACIGGKIPAAQAATAGRRETRMERSRGKPSANLGTASRRGLRRIINDTLSQLYRKGLIRRVSYGIYAPLLPKVYQAS